MGCIIQKGLGVVGEDGGIINKMTCWVCGLGGFAWALGGGGGRGRRRRRRGGGREISS